MGNRTVSGVAAVIGGMTMRGTKRADYIYSSDFLNCTRSKIKDFLARWFRKGEL